MLHQQHGVGISLKKKELFGLQKSRLNEQNQLKMDLPSCFLSSRGFPNDVTCGCTRHKGVPKVT